MYLICLIAHMKCLLILLKLSSVDSKYTMNLLKLSSVDSKKGNRHIFAEPSSVDGKI